jgi:hypothetical protein
MRAKERGAVAIVVVIVIALLLGFLGLSLETGHVLAARGELQNGADAAALAGARRLDGTNKNFVLQGAEADARNFARAHPTDQYDVEPFVVQLGHWASAGETCATFGGTEVADSPASPDGHHFCNIPGRAAADAANITAVRVVTRRQGTPGGTGGGAVAHPFGGILGKSQSDVAAEAIAVTGSPGPDAGEECPEFPFTVKQSCVKNGGMPRCDEGPILFYIGLAASGIDSAGLTIFRSAACDSGTGSDEKFNGANGWGTQDVCDVLDDRCGDRPVDGQCISIKNGDNVSGNCSHGGGKICDLLRDKVGQTGQVPLVEYSPGENCDGGFASFNYTHAARVKGIATVRLVGAQCLTGQDKGIRALPGYEAEVAKCDFANGSCFVVEFMCAQTDDDKTGINQDWTGTAVLEPGLVR